MEIILAERIEVSIKIVESSNHFVKGEFYQISKSKKNILVEFISF
jgi:hypothetical protein